MYGLSQENSCGCHSASAEQAMIMKKKYLTMNFTCIPCNGKYFVDYLKVVHLNNKCMKKTQKP